MPKAYYAYHLSDGSATYSFLQDTVAAAALSNIAAAVGTPRLPHKLKPRRVSIRFGTGPYSYKHYIIGNATFTGLGLGTAVLAGTVVGQDDEVNNGQSAY